MIRRAFLAVVLGISSTVPVLQVIAAFFVCLVALVIQQVTSPYVDVRHDRLATVSLIVIMLMMLCALLLMTEKDSANPSLPYSTVNESVYAMFWTWGMLVTCCLFYIPALLMYRKYLTHRKLRKALESSRAASLLVHGNPYVVQAIDVAHQAFDEQAACIAIDWIKDLKRTNTELASFSKVFNSLVAESTFAL